MVAGGSWLVVVRQDQELLRRLTFGLSNRLYLRERTQIQTWSGFDVRGNLWGPHGASDRSDCQQLRSVVSSRLERRCADVGMGAVRLQHLAYKAAHHREE